MSARLLANAGLFQLGWLACVLGANQPLYLLAAGLCLMLQLALLPWREQWPGLLAVALAGSLLDSALGWLGVFDFAGDALLLPAWLALLWCLFATTLRHSLAWSAAPLWLGMLLGALAGPLSYWAGSRLAGVGLPLGTLPSLMLLGLLWALLLPALHLLVRLRG